MPRRVREFALEVAGGPPGGGAADGYLDKVVKYVPADVIAAWTAIGAVIKAAPQIPHVPVLLVCFLVALGFAYWWTLKTTDAAGQPPATKQAIIAVVAFAVWVLALGDLDEPLKLLTWWDVAYAKIILIFFTLASGKL